MAISETGSSNGSGPRGRFGKRCAENRERPACFPNSAFSFLPVPRRRLSRRKRDVAGDRSEMAPRISANRLPPAGERLFSNPPLPPAPAPSPARVVERSGSRPGPAPVQTKFSRRERASRGRLEKRILGGNQGTYRSGSCGRLTTQRPCSPTTRLPQPSRQSR